MSIQELTIQSLAPTGHGIADNGWYILGAYPGDIIQARVYKEAEGITYAEIMKIVSASKHRTYTPTTKPFFDANAPWAYLDQAYENKVKKEIVRDIFKTTSGVEITSQILNNKLKTTHYRNKVAYSFMESGEKLSFALYTRGVSGVEKIIQTDNLLVHEVLNKVGKQFLEFFNQKKVPLETLKYLILRYSYYTGTVVAQILVTGSNRKKIPWKKSDLETLIHQHREIKGVLVSHSEPGIRSSTTTKDFYEIGTTEITEKLLDREYTYHPSQFFQIYPEAFSEILVDCEELITKIPHHENYELLDLFAGVGVIGLHLAHLVQNVHGVEQSPLAKRYALKNAKQHEITKIASQARNDRFTFTEADVDEALEYITPNQILIVDPARSGLTKKVIAKITREQPEYIIYISCNPETQAEDYNKIKNYYTIEWSRAYNLFPKTSHVEHVIFLKQKTK